METNKNTLGKIEKFNYDTVTFHGFEAARNPAYIFTMMLCKFIKPDIEFEYKSDTEYRAPVNTVLDLSKFNELKFKEEFPGELPQEYSLVKKFFERFWGSIFSNRLYAEYCYTKYILPIFRIDEVVSNRAFLEYISCLIGIGKLNMVSDMMLDYIEFAVSETMKLSCDVEVIRTFCDLDTEGLIALHVPKFDYGSFDFDKNIQLISPGTKLFVYPIEWDSKSIKESATCIEMIDKSTKMQVRLLEALVNSGKDYSKSGMTYQIKGLEDAIKIAKQCLQEL